MPWNGRATHAEGNQRDGCERSLPTMETFAYPVDAVSKGGREKAETYEPLWKIADRHRVLKVPEGREKKKKKKKKGGKKKKRKIFRYL